MLRGSSVITVAFLGLASISPAQVQPPDYDFQWRTIGAPGNRAANQQEAPLLQGFPVGAVANTFRLTRTEVTVSRWFEFVQAYAPYLQGAPSSAFTSFWIRWNGSSYGIIPGSENYPADMSWRFAARYCNWLTNGRATTAGAFESGAYDTSTFTQNANGTRNDQIAHSPGATFWIPTWDEWTKGFFYDPNRYGPGVEGYWPQPAGRIAFLHSGLPADGGETSAGIPGLDGFPVASYGSVQSPWGLLDGSGGVSEWTETISGLPERSRILKGSYTGEPFPDYTTDDRLDRYSTGFPVLPGDGLRIASAVPAPGAFSIVLMGIGLLTRRRVR